MISGKTILNVVIALAIFALLDRMFLGSMLDKVAPK